MNLKSRLDNTNYDDRTSCSCRAMTSNRSNDRVNESDDDDGNVRVKKSSMQKRSGTSNRKRSEGNNNDVATQQQYATSPDGSTTPGTATSSRRTRPVIVKSRSNENDDEDSSSKQSHSTKSSAVSLPQKESIQQRQQRRLGKINEISTSNVPTIVESDTNNFFGTEDMTNFGGFANGDAVFSSTTFPPTITNTSNIKGLDTSFDAAFASDGNFDSAFNTGNSAFGQNTTSPFLTNGLDAFDTDIIPDFGGMTLQPDEKKIVYDHTPLTKAPKMEPPSLVLQHDLIMRKNFHCAPVQNPANGNIMFITCSSSHDATLHEVDPNRNFIQVSSIPIISSELRRVVTTKYNATIKNVQKIWTLAIGLMDCNTKREQLAIIIDLRILEAATTMRLVIMWQRDHTSAGFGLFHVTTPPSGGDFACDLSTLQVSDGLLFVGGASPKGSCIFISKPTYREAWSANFVTGMGSVLALSVAIAKPYLVVALADKSITVWTYQSALVKAKIGETENSQAASKRWLFPLCRLNYKDSLDSAAFEYPGIFERGMQLDSNSHSQDIGYCTNMVWLPTSSSFPSLTLLSVAFENGFVTFHVDLPVVKNSSSENGYHAFPESTQTTVITAAPLLSPIVAKRWKGKYEHSCLSWVQLGPFDDTCIAVVLHDSLQPIARIVLCAIHFPIKCRGFIPKIETGLSCRILASSTVSKNDVNFPVGVLHCFDSIILCAKQSLSSMRLSSVIPESSNVNPASLVNHPVMSNPFGLSSTGDPFMSDTLIDNDSVLYIHSTIHCERQTGTKESELLHWNLPTRRFWLCRAIAGDSMQTLVDEVKEESGFEESYQVFGGGNVQVICELNDEALNGLTPMRIVRCWRKRVCIIIYRRAIGYLPISKEKTSFEAERIAFVDFSDESTFIEIAPGRDAAFFPSDKTNFAQGLILSLDGLSVTYFDFNRIEGLKQASSFRPILGIDDDSDYIDARRIIVFSDETKLNMAILGRQYKDNRMCFVTGDVSDIDEATSVDCSKLLPNIVSGGMFCLDANEDVVAIIGLQGDGSGYRNFAMSTSRRVLILSSSLSLSGESLHNRTNGLAPIGSFAVCFATNDKIRYLCCLNKELSTGAVASLGQSTLCYTPVVLFGIRPDRMILYSTSSGKTLCEPGQNIDAFRLPVPITRPAMFLEPMIANAVCIGEKSNGSNPILYLVIEKFGRKVSSIAHGEKEGIGSYGAGLTPGCFEILRHFGVLDAASWLLTGTVKFDRSVNSRLLPPWLPIGPKSSGALSTDAVLHLLSNGDSYFSDYIKSPERNIVSTLPRQSDSTALLCREFAKREILSGNPFDTLKLLDVSGAESTENLALLLSLNIENRQNKDSVDVLKMISGTDNGKANRPESGKASSLLATLALMSSATSTSKQKGQVGSTNGINSWVTQLAPSLQRSKQVSRSRKKLMGGKLEECVQARKSSDPIWNIQCNESKHVWNEGPRKEKESLLLLDSIEDWLGRRRPLIFGKEGASAVKERGEKTLADILNQDDDSFGAKTNDLESSTDDGWVDGVGEGRSDEANLSAYFRMSEGEDDDSLWRVNGFVDLSPYQNVALVFGDTTSFILQSSTSSVDEGEPGKVKSLYDLVFATSGLGVPSGLGLPAPRGSSLDVGVLQFSNRESRKKASIEFWFFLPESDQIFDEIILVRRTWGLFADDLTKVAIASERKSTLWELALRRNGEFEFRTCGGSSLVSTNRAADTTTSDDSTEEIDKPNTAMFGRWNHVCIVLSSKGLMVSECNVTLYVKGVKTVAGKTQMLPAADSAELLNNSSKLDDAMKKSYLLFGLNHCVDFRLTELRVWSCERTADDVQSFLYEYLTAAEQKKKFKVKIASKNKVGTAFGQPKGLLGSSKKTVDGTNKVQQSQTGGIIFSLKPPKPTSPATHQAISINSPKNTDNLAESTSEFTSSLESRNNENASKVTEHEKQHIDVLREEKDDVQSEQDVAVTLWDSAIPLSQQLRPSAAAALIRGPPATRHYGGNRGGLPDFSGEERSGVGGIAICGSEKTIVFRDNEEPPAVTYPIGASGAIVSDQMDDEGSEFLCCFLAKEGRMVVFELRSRTVVVELQMTTKLNFWRYLPPEAAYNSLCYMLITPVGGFHWKPLEESPRPHQVWKRGSELQGKKVVTYEEGGSNGGESDDICSRVGLITVTRSSSGSYLEGWLLPISGDSKPQPLPTNLLGACLCQPRLVDDVDPFLPILITATITDGIFSVNVFSISEPRDGSMSLGDKITSHIIDEYDVDGIEFDPPVLAMGPLPEVLCVSLSNIIVVILRKKGLVAAFEIDENELNIIAMEYVDHFVIDAVMRYSSEVGGAEIVMLLSDVNNQKDGRIVSFCFRSTEME